MMRDVESSSGSILFSRAPRILRKPHLAAACLALVCAASGSWYQPAALAPGGGRLPSRKGERLQIRNNFGIVDVAPWDRNEVEAHWWSPNPNSDVRVDLLKQGSKIFLMASSPGNAAVKMEVRVPPGIDLEVRGIQPKVTVEGVRGTVVVDTLRGDVSVTGATGDVNAYSGSGDILYHVTNQPRKPARLVTRRGDIHCHLPPGVRVGVQAATSRGRDSGEVALKGSNSCTRNGKTPCLTMLSHDGGQVYLYRNGEEYTWHDGEEPSRLHAPELRTGIDSIPDDLLPDPPKPGGTGEPAVSFNVEVEWVRLNLSVVERKGGRRIWGLRSEDFEVYEDGILQQNEFLQDTNEPFHLLVLLDVSGSTASYLPLLKGAVSGFAETLRPNDRIAVAAFNSQAFLVQDFTNDRAVVGKALDKITAGGGTGVYGALRFALARLSRIDGRKALVVFTDGIDDGLFGMFETSADVTFPEVFGQVEETDALIYIISLDSEKTIRAWLAGGDNEPLADPALREARAQLKAISEQSGTPLFSPTRVSQLAPTFAGIAAEIKSRYTLAYRSNNPIKDGRRRKITVKIAGHPEYAVRTRRGYYAGGPAGRPADQSPR